VDGGGVVGSTLGLSVWLGSGLSVGSGLAAGSGLAVGSGLADGDGVSVGVGLGEVWAVATPGLVNKPDADKPMTTIHRPAASERPIIRRTLHAAVRSRSAPTHRLDGDRQR
jgi:hypothetical protein